MLQNVAKNKKLILTCTCTFIYCFSCFSISSQNESEIIPFPNKEVEFELSGEDFKDLITKEYPRISNDSAQEDKSEVKSDTGIILSETFRKHFSNLTAAPNINNHWPF